jgi:chemotaxis protein MotA
MSYIPFPGFRASLLTGVILISLSGTILISEYIPFLDPFSLIIVLGGTLLSGIISFEANSITKAFNEAYHSKALNSFITTERLAYFSNLSQIARQKGNMALEKFARQEEDPILRKGLQMVADGTPVEEIRYLLNMDITVSKAQKTESVDILFYLASIAPAAGLIGTVTGLIFMLSQIENSSQLSSGMSLALLTTLYGAILSYLVLQPLATKLQKHIKDDEMLQILTLEGILALAKGINPQLMQERLEAFAN